MNTLLINTKAFISSKADYLTFFQSLSDKPTELQVYLALPASIISYARDILKGNPSIAIATQDISSLGTGAYTGSESPELLADLGAQYACIGHSETRISDATLEEDITEKINTAVENQLTPIVFVGYTYDSDISDTIEILAHNVQAILDSKAKKLTLVLETQSELTDSLLKSAYKLIYKKLKGRDVQFLVGGNIDSDTMTRLQKLRFIDGFAIGHQALDTKERQVIYEQFNR